MEFRRHLFPASLLLLAALGCEERSVDLDLAELTPGERLYVERVVTLERARSLALVDRPRGTALLDSLAAAWGDSVKVDLLDGLPTDPFRAEGLHALLVRVMAAEHDSLRRDPTADRLDRPLPDPGRPAHPDSAATAAGGE
ncbi:hypothetical protein KDM41_09690 [bacterium]|nr:hypothetical protein [bacterium]